MPATVTLEPRGNPTAQQPIERGDVLLGLAGNWSAVLELADPQDAPQSGLVTLRWMGQALQGAVTGTPASQEGKTTVLVDGGNGGLNKAQEPKHYQNAPASLVLTELATAAGERLGASSGSGLRLSGFPRRAASAAAVLDDLARTLGQIWRIELDGSLTFGYPTWPPAPTFDHDLLPADGVHQTSELVNRAWGPIPGQTYRGKRVGAAHYFIAPGGGRIRLWYQTEAISLDMDPLRSGLRGFIKETLPLTWHGKYPGVVRSVRGDNLVDVVLDYKDLPPLVGVPIRTFAPGARIVPPMFSRCEVFFENADPRYPVAHCFDGGSAQRGVARLDDLVAGGALTGVVTVSAFGVPVAVQFIFTPPGGSPSAPSPTASLSGKISTASDRAYLP